MMPRHRHRHRSANRGEGRRDGHATVSTGEALAAAAARSQPQPHPEGAAVVLEGTENRVHCAHPDGALRWQREGRARSPDVVLWYSFEVFQVTSIETAAQTWSADVRLQLRWLDPAVSPAQVDAVRRLTRGDNWRSLLDCEWPSEVPPLWQPRPKLLNAVDTAMTASFRVISMATPSLAQVAEEMPVPEAMLHRGATGHTTGHTTGPGTGAPPVPEPLAFVYSLHGTATFRCRMQLRAFPFDTQSLNVVVASLGTGRRVAIEKNPRQQSIFYFF